MCIYPNCNKKPFKRKNGSFSKFCKKHLTSVSEFKFIEKYGEEEGKRKWNEYLEKQRKSSIGKKYKPLKLQLLEKYGEEEGKRKWNEYLEKQRKSNSLNGYIEKYGEEEGKRKWNEYLEKQRNIYTPEKRIEKSKKMKYVNSIEYYIEKYGEEEGIKKFKEWKKSQDHSSLNFFIQKYGEEEGNKKYQNSIKNKQNRKKGFTSIIANNLFSIISAELNIENETIYGDEEHSIRNNKKIYFYDFKYKNKIIEFNGDIWHGNPIKFNENECPNPYRKNTTAKEIWKEDNNKINTAKNKGYDIFIVWETDYKLNPVEVKNKCINFLKNK